MIHHRSPLRASHHRLMGTALWLLLSAFYLLPNAVGQSATASLSGTVEDQNKAVVPGAEVTAINLGTGLERVTQTNDSGHFTFLLLPPSSYTIRVARQGFASVEISNVILNVGDQKALRIELKTGAITAMVKIESGAPLIDESPAVGTVVDRQFVENLPLNGRSFSSLITLSPGVVLTKATATEQGQFSVNGQRSDANYFTVDGVSANFGVMPSANLGQSGGGSTPATAASGGTNNLVSLEALQEFKIQTSTYAPEFGRTPGAQVQIITRSGTNQFHGSLFEYFRNEALDANDWFNNALRLPKPALRQNNFGGVLGGPFYLPRFGEGGPSFWNGKDRTFFFFSYESLRLRLPQTRSVDVPSLAARAAAPAAVRPILDAFSLPNGPDRIGVNNQPNGLAVFNTSFSAPSSLDATSIRIDHRVNGKLFLFGRYNYSPSAAEQRGTNSTVNNIIRTDIVTQTLTSSATFSFSAKTTNEIVLNYSRNSGSLTAELDDFGGAKVPDDSLIFPVGTSRQNDIVSFFILGQANTIFQIGSQVVNVQRQFNLVDNLSIIARDHQLKFGVDYRRLFPIIRPNNYNSLIQFNGIGTPGAAVQPAGSALSGNIQGASISGSTGERVPVFNNFSMYAQDTWHVNRRLTMTYGLRWEVNPPPTESNGNAALTVAGLENPATATLAPRGTPLWKTTYGNFAPRFGISYLLTQSRGRETILRGGVGVFYDLGVGPIANAFGSAYPFTATKILGVLPFPLSGSNAAAPPVTSNVSGALLVAEPNLKLPRVFQWNLAVERALGIHQSISASYVAAVGRKLLRQERLANTTFGGPLNPTIFASSAGVSVIRNSATSDYHALQLQFHRRLSAGLQALASYTWSHSIDVASNDSVNLNVPANLNAVADRGASDFDIRHALTGATSYEIPVSGMGSLDNAILKGWSLDTIFTARSAPPVNVSLTRTIPGIGVVLVRPDLISGIPLYVNDPAAPGGSRFNSAVPTPAQVAAAGCAPVSTSTPAKGPFCIPAIVRQGTFGRNVLRGFPVYQIDLALRRQFNLSERTSLQFKAELFNILNHPNFADPSGLLSTSTFGVSTQMLGRSLGSGGFGGGLNPLYQVGGPRSIQLALRLTF